METAKKIWIISSEPPLPTYSEGNSSSGEYIFKEEVDVQKLQLMITDFCDCIDESLEGIEPKKSNFKVDSIEISATMAVDGKLGILGTSIGAKAEGAIKFIFKRNT